jgi:hypothetical protein
MSMVMSTEILNQAGKINILRVTTGVRPKLEHSRFRGNMSHRVNLCVLSKKRDG